MTDKVRRDVSVGVVTEAFPDALFRIKFKNEKPESLAYLSGKMKLNRIKVMIGDSVEVVCDPYGGKGRIVKRIDNNSRQTI